jgi:hypothetical protein
MALAASKTVNIAFVKMLLRAKADVNASFNFHGVS